MATAVSSATVDRMARSLRLEFPGAVYHVMSRGNRREAIYHDDVDRRAWLRILALICKRHRCVVHGFCQMNNHYHLLIETADANLAQAMRQLNGLYAQHVNKRHNLVGHLFQGRYKAILVQKSSYLLELSRYIVLNPLRGKIVLSLDDWKWSSFRYFLGRKPAKLAEKGLDPQPIRPDTCACDGALRRIRPRWCGRRQSPG